jgi:hypothetical protein
MLTSRRITVFAATAFALAIESASPAPPARPGVLVELFTSEGCSSCPPADALLAKLLETQPVAGAEIVPIELHVDYWDRLGWRDPFSSAAFSRRQEEYSHVFGPDRVYTPQMVVDGAHEFVGSDARLAAGAIKKAGALPHLPLSVSADLQDGTARISVAAPGAPAEATEKIRVIVAVVEDGLTSSVKHGENAGRTLTHAAVTRRLETISTLQREAVPAEARWKIGSGWQAPKLRVVAFLQGEKTLRVYGATQARLPAR